MVIRINGSLALEHLSLKVVQVPRYGRGIEVSMRLKLVQGVLQGLPSPYVQPPGIYVKMRLGNPRGRAR